jgi:hypothetical protein
MKPKIINYIPYIGYVAIIIYFFKDFLYQITPDSISYIDIAQHYADRNFYAALNGYWSPLVSWIMALGFKIYAFSPTHKIFIFKCINVLGGLAALLVLSKITAYFVAQALWRVLTLVSGAIWLAFLVLAHLTADILLLPLLLYYWYLCSANHWLTRPYTLGIVGALIYFAKYYCFFPFLIFYHWKIMGALWQTTPPMKKGLYVSYAKTMTVFGLVAGIWIGLLSYKYGGFTVSTAGGFNHAMMIDGTLENYCFRGAITPLPHPKATFFWEDIALTCHYTDWSPMASWQNFKLQLLVMKNNLRDISQLLFYLLPATKFMALLALLYLLGKQKHRKQAIVDILFWVIVYLSGYVLLEVQDRFLWIVILLFIVLSAFLVEQYTEMFKPSKVQLCLLALAFLYFNARIACEKFKEPHWAIDGYAEWQNMVANQCPTLAGKQIAAFETDDKNPWYMAYYSKCHYWGGIKPLIEQPDTLATVLQQYDISYLILPKTAALPNNLTQKFEQVCESIEYNIYERL